MTTVGEQKLMSHAGVSQRGDLVSAPEPGIMPQLLGGRTDSREDTGWPKISVIIPCLNQVAFLKEAIESVFNQRYPGCQLIVMDGGSTDGSVDIIKSFEARIDYWQSMADGGQSSAINEGAKRANGDLVCWLNSDDFLLDDALWIVGRAASVHPNFGVYIGNGFRFDEKSRKRTPFSTRSLGFSRRALREGLDYVQQPSTFYRRRAWDAVGGLDPGLRFGLDWDLLIRVAAKYPVVLINEFLSCSREYESTKTAAGGLVRAVELSEICRRHTGRQLTVGALVYLLEALRGGLLNYQSASVRQWIAAAEHQARSDLVEIAGYRDGFPACLDTEDVTFVPLANPGLPIRPPVDDHDLPAISIVTPSFNQAEFLPRTLASVAVQRYPKIEHIVIDGDSTDGSADILERHSDQLSYWECTKDSGPAQAINKGFRRATGEILSWLNSDDMLAEGALEIVGRTFRDHPDVDVIFANALYIDSNDQPALMDHGTHKTALYFGEVQPRNMIPAYWRYVHAVPQPTVFFRRRLFERAGFLDETYRFIFDFEMFFRFTAIAKFVKIERTTALYRIHRNAKTAEWSEFLVELYRLSRKNWPRWNDPQFRSTRGDFVLAFMKREWPFSHETTFMKTLFWIARQSLAAAVTMKLFNPETVARDLRRWANSRASRDTSGPTLPDIFRDGTREEAPGRDAPKLMRAPTTRYSAVFCGFFLPLYPGISGGEIRDFHILRHLVSFCRLSFVSLHGSSARSDSWRIDILSPLMESVWDPAAVVENFRDLVDFEALAKMMRRTWRITDDLRRRNLPVIGPRFPRDTSVCEKIAAGYFVKFIQTKLRDDQTDFLFVSPQLNPLGILVDKSRFSSRMILATYDLETIRLRRMAAGMQGLGRVAGLLEARRGRQYERRNLDVYDGIIAVSGLDRSMLIDEMGVEADRVVSIENGVDVEHFAYCERRCDGPPAVLFVGAFTYRPNHLAAVRLVDRIMPLVWKVAPATQVWIVGQQPEPNLYQRSDGRRIFVTGRVDSVRPYLRQCRLVCAPIEIGSGTRYKILEALAAGAPVVCTRIAAEGLNLTSEHIVIADSDAEIAAAICEILHNPEHSSIMSKQARRLVEEKYSWNVVLSKLEPWLDQIASLPRKV
jgi:glycosyltransferase involved in cell wall biosynthesis